MAGFFAAMREFSNGLIREGHSVFNIRLDDSDNEHTLEGNLQKLIRKPGFTRFEYLFPDEYRLDRQVEAIAARLPVPVGAVDSEHFLTKSEDVQRFFQGKKRFLMEKFYRPMRRRHNNILLKDGTPACEEFRSEQPQPIRLGRAHTPGQGF